MIHLSDITYGQKHFTSVKILLVELFKYQKGLSIPAVRRVQAITGRNHMFPYFWNVAETCNSMFPLCLRKSGPVPLYTQQRKREKKSRNR